MKMKQVSHALGVFAFLFTLAVDDVYSEDYYSNFKFRRKSASGGEENNGVNSLSSSAASANRRSALQLINSGELQ